MLRSIYGWSKNSDEPSTYVHLSGETVKKALLEKAGLKQKVQEEPAVIMCPRCGNPNQPNASLCVKCKGVLKIQDAVSIDGIVAEIGTLKSMLGVLMGLQTRKMDFEEIKKLAEGNKAFVELAKKHGLTTRVDGKK
jgi:hypothetical protein